MSSFLKQLTHPKTNKEQACLCIDDYFGQHRYGYFFRKDGKDANWDDFHLLQKSGDNFDIFNEDEISS